MYNPEFIREVADELGEDRTIPPYESIANLLSFREAGRTCPTPPDAIELATDAFRAESPARVGVFVAHRRWESGCYNGEGVGWVF